MKTISKWIAVLIITVIISSHLNLAFADNRYDVSPELILLEQVVAGANKASTETVKSAIKEYSEKANPRDPKRGERMIEAAKTLGISSSTFEHEITSLTSGQFNEKSFSENLAKLNQRQGAQFNACGPAKVTAVISGVAVAIIIGILSQIEDTEIDTVPKYHKLNKAAGVSAYTFLASAVVIAATCK
jgi:hypothetical protein